MPVAVKTLSSRDPNVIQRFIDEAELMKKFIHPNIVGLLGEMDVTSLMHNVPKDVSCMPILR